MSLLSDISKLLEEGLSHEGVYVIRGMPGTGKSTFALTVVKEMLEKEVKCAFLSTRDSADGIKKLLQSKFKLDEKTVSSISFMDAFSSGELSTSSSDLSFFSFKIKNILDSLPSGGFFVFDSLSSFLMYNSPADVAKFVQTQVARCRQKRITMLIVIEEGMSEEKTIELVSYFVDAIFEVKIDENDRKRFFRVYLSKFGACDITWHEFKITDSGFEFTSLDNKYFK